jgi:hypothetical protein
MATYTPKRLGTNPVQLSTSGTTSLYTAPASTTAIIKQLVVANTTASNATFNLSITGSVAASRALFQGLVIGANSTAVIDLSVVLQPTEGIFASTGTASALTLTISGVEITP